MEWKTNGLMLLFSNRNIEMRTYPASGAGLAGGIEGATGPQRVSWGHPGDPGRVPDGREISSLVWPDNAAAEKTAKRVHPGRIGFPTIKTGPDRVKGGVLCRRLAYTCQLLA